MEAARGKPEAYIEYISCTLATLGNIDQGARAHPDEMDPSTPDSVVTPLMKLNEIP